VNSLMRSGSRLTACSMLIASLMLIPGSASASPETLKRSVSNMLQSPLDFVLSPMTSLVGVSAKIVDQDDSTGVRVFFIVPGYVWYTGVIVGAAVIRGVTGLIEVIPGVLLLPFPEADMDPLFDPVDSAAALVEIDTPCCIYVKFGIDYTAPVY
jgi:hypothetical protein